MVRNDRLTPGERLAVRLGVSQTWDTTTTHTHVLRVFSVYDGTLLYTHTSPTTTSPWHATLYWVPVPEPTVPSQAASMLRHLQPLDAPTDLSDDKPGWVGSVHARSRPTAPPPSANVPKGTGVLAQLPSLASGTSHASLLLCADAGGQLSFWLDGTVPIGPVSLPTNAEILSIVSDCHTASVLLQDEQTWQSAHIPLPLSTPLWHIAKLSTDLRTYLTHILDATFYAARAWISMVRPRAVEWQAHWDDLAKRHGVDIVLEWMALIMTGRASPACEQLLAQLTEGTTLAMETDAKRGLKHIRRLMATHVVPACERLLILLTELQGCAQWRASYPMAALDDVVPLLRQTQTCHAVAMALQEDVEREWLALDEYYQWWRMEQDRQERRKLGEDVPRVLTYHDTLTVLEYVQRGFLSPSLDAMLGAPTTPAHAPDADTSDDSHALTAPLWTTPAVVYETAAPSKPPTKVASALASALAWVDQAPRAPATATTAQWQGVFHVPTLFAGPAHTYAPRTLPGDAQTLVTRAEKLCTDTARVLVSALHQAGSPAPTLHTAWERPTSVLCRDEAVRSVPAEAPATIPTHVPRPVVRAVVHHEQHVHTYATHDTLVTLSLPPLTTASADVPRETHPAHGEVLDFAVTPHDLHVLSTTSHSTQLRSVAWSHTDTKGPPAKPVDLQDGTLLAVFQHGLRVVAHRDRRALTVL